jgi:PAS domain S-box-containing protein
MSTRREQEQALMIHDLRLRLEEAEEVLTAIRRGEVDALVVKPGVRPQIWSLNGVDHVYRVLFETLNEGALTVDAEGTILYSNTQFAGLVGQRLQRVLGTPFLGYVAPEDADLFRMLLERGLRRSSKGEIHMVRPDGEQVPVMLSLNAVEIEQVGSTCTVVVSDLTELKRVQAALVEANGDLEARVQERTAALRSEVAERSRLAEQLREADRRKNEFLAMLGHELRNPLAPVMNGIELIRRRCGDDPDIERVRLLMERQLRHMSRLVDDLLDVSRITRGTIELRRETVDLAAVVDAATRACRPVLDAAEHELSVELPAVPCWIEGDMTRLEQVVMNLISNAAKYTPPRGHIRVALERHGDWAELSVHDDGRGIPREMLDGIFELFAQVDTTIDRSLGGLGIGLTVVRNLVQLHGGTVHASSDGDGKGSEFLVRLPLVPLGRLQLSDPRGGGEQNTEGLRVLVVEDNVDAAETLAELVRLWGHTVEIVHRGEAAVEAALGFQPQVVVLDIGLPGMDGYAVAAKLRQQEPLAGVRLFALTGYGQEQDRRRAHDAGFDVHLTKPIHPDHLRKLLSEAAAARWESEGAGGVEIRVPER